MVFLLINAQILLKSFKSNTHDMGNAENSSHENSSQEFIFGLEWS